VPEAAKALDVTANTGKQTAYAFYYLLSLCACRSSMQQTCLGPTNE